MFNRELSFVLAVTVWLTLSFECLWTILGSGEVLSKSYPCFLRVDEIKFGVN